MQRTFTFKKNLFRKLPFSFLLLGLLISQLAVAHNVTGYTAGCASGPKYSIDPTVNSVNSYSNYAWQYKNGTSWVCIINGSNTINGSTFTVSGARSAGTDPAPIVFSGANNALDNVIIRCIIADGSNVNPCSTSNTLYNAGSDSKNFTIDVTNTVCGASNIMSLGNRVWYDKDNTGTNNDENGIANVELHLYKDDNNDNTADGGIIATASTNGDGYYMFYNLVPGNYIVGAVTPAGYMPSSKYSNNPDDNINYDNNGFKAVGNEIRGNAITLLPGDEPNGNSNITYDFGFLPDCSCTTSSSNLLKNGSFEEGTAYWNWNGTNTNFTTGTGYQVCGSYNAFNDWKSGISNVYQDVAVTPGAVVTFKGFAGTHTAGQASGSTPKLGLIFFNGSTQLSQLYEVKVDQDVDKNYNQLEQYTITATVPATATKVRVQSSINTDYMKLDAFCLTTTSTTLTLGSTVWYDTDNDGKFEAGEAGINNATVHLYRASNTAAGAFIATATTNASGTYSFPGLAAGDYVVGVVIPAGYLNSTVNGGDPDNNIDNDNNGQATVGDEARGLPITLTLGGEPEGNVNNTYDFGFLPDCSCTTSANNLLVNGSFEDGTTGWTATGGSISTGTGYVACGAKNGFNNWSSGTSTVYQDVAVNVGETITFKGFAGTHTAGIACSPKLSLVFYKGSTMLSPQYDVTVDRDVDKNNSQLKQYTITATVPAGATKVRVQSTITCNVMKMDAFCLTSTCTTPATPVVSVTQPTCASSYNKVVITNLPAYNWIISGTLNGTAFTSISGYGSSLVAENIAAGTYVITIKVPGGCAAAPVTFTVNSQPVTPTAPVATITQTICNGSLGAILLTGLPTSGSWTITQKKTVGTTTTTSTISNSGTAYVVKNLTAATYTYTVTNSDGCTSPVTSITLGMQNPTYTVSGVIWNDANKNGRYETTESTLSEVQVKLYRDIDLNGVADELAGTLDLTNGTSRYTFNSVCPGSYVVNFSVPNGYTRTIQLNTVPTAATNDSDPNQANGTTGTFTLGPNSITNVNAGYYATTILPVDFGTIAAQARNCEVLLTFEVLTQRSTKQFEIQSSKDGSNWGNIGIVSAKASSSTAYKYSFTHTQPVAGINLYRIKVVDSDGKISYSQVMTATSVCSGKGQITTYPNPATDMLNVSLPTTYQDAQLQLFSATGQLMVSDMKKTGLVRSLNTGNLTPGIYLLKVVQNNSVVMTQKIIKGE